MIERRDRHEARISHVDDASPSESTAIFAAAHLLDLAHQVPTSAQANEFVEGLKFYLQVWL